MTGHASVLNMYEFTFSQETDYERLIGARGLQWLDIGGDAPKLSARDPRVFRRPHWTRAEVGDNLIQTCLLDEVNVMEVGKDQIQLVQVEALPDWAKGLKSTRLDADSFWDAYNLLDLGQFQAAVTLETLYERIFGQVFSFLPDSKPLSTARFPPQSLRKDDFRLVYPGSLVGADDSSEHTERCFIRLFNYLTRFERSVIFLDQIDFIDHGKGTVANAFRSACALSMGIKQ